MGFANTVGVEIATTTDTGINITGIFVQINSVNLDSGIKFFEFHIKSYAVGRLDTGDGEMATNLVLLSKTFVW